uniref:ATPase subunit 8 n=1 Tax=Skeletonema marinoi TaxID=267567 RepID=A0A0S2M9V7_9STRA|nr:ATPase subunit 8 [Skeletonema marinoi]ALO71453.1 ATPase subunit 8 [Skeletonema marinoi]
MPQFDFLTLGAQVFGLLITLSLFYYFSINTVIPNFVEVEKSLEQKLIKNTTSISAMNLDLTNNKKLINNSYKLFMQ